MSGAVLVTGGATRIGRAICLNLAANGFVPIVHFHRSAAAAQSLCEEIGGGAVAVQADLTQSAAIAQLAEHGRALGVAGLVNNASTFLRTAVGSTTEAEFDQLMASNAKGAYLLAQGLLDSLRAIVNITDVHAHLPLKGYVVYSMAKAALAQMTRSLAKELAPDVRVNAVAPGAILWPEPEPSARVKARILAQIPLGRLGTPADVARAVTFLLQSDYITGQTITVDGGRSL